MAEEDLESNESTKRHFDISAAVIRQLGEELVTDEVTAIMELIKNAYDADADWVKVEVNLNEFYNNSEAFYQNSRKGYITIEDNGFGMSETDIWDSWMKISLSFKKKFKQLGKVTPKGRTPLGEKGVGRLSTQRLGARLEMFTGKVGSLKTNHVAFDWDQFDDDTSLTAVPVHIDDFPKTLSKKGTTLVITNLKEENKWKGDSWDRFRGQISQMIFPFKEKRVFEVYLKLNGQSVDLDEVNQKVRQNAVANYSFELGGDKITLKGEIKLQKLGGSSKRDDLLFFETKILPDFGKDFFNYLTDEKDNKKLFVPGLKYSQKPGGFITFQREISFSQLSKIFYVEVENDTKEPSDSSDAAITRIVDGASQEEIIEVVPPENKQVDEQGIKLEVAHPGNFEGEISDFNFKDSQDLDSAFDSFAQFKKLVQNQVGVRVFRDGFGIKPYGVDGEDWMRLSDNQTSGGSYYGLRPGNVVGFVVLTAKDNKDLKEKTDREGFVDSPYSRNFFRVMNYVRDEINTILESTRRSFNDYRAKKGEEASGISTISDSFTKLKQTSNKAKKSSERSNKVRFNLASVANKIVEITSSESAAIQQNPEIAALLKTLGDVLKEAGILLLDVDSILNDARVLDQHVEFLQPQIQKLEQQLSDFSELAALGLTAEALSHELTNIVDRMIEETDKVAKRLNQKTDIDQNSIKIYVEHVRSAARSFRKQLSHLAPSLKYVREIQNEIDVWEYLQEIQSYYIDRFKDKIDVFAVMLGSSFTIRINKGKLTQILDNLILNSEYWLMQKKSGVANFKPTITLQIQEPFIKIFDNGNGVDKSIQNQIFQPFITGKPKSEGRGLGLFIVQQLLETSGCDIMLLNEKNDNQQKFIFQLNMSNVII